MSAFGKHGSRCDTCGKFSKNRQGEYVRKDGSAGYIWPEDNENDTGRDICSDCIDGQAKAETKDFFVLGESSKSGVVIRCADRDIAEHELGLMRWSNCSRIARTSRAVTESDVLPWFTSSLPLTKRDSRFN